MRGARRKGCCCCFRARDIIVEMAVGATRECIERTEREGREGEKEGLKIGWEWKLRYKEY